MKVRNKLAVEVEAPVPLVITMADEPAEFVTDLMLNAEPVVVPDKLYKMLVPDPVIDELVIVSVMSVAAAKEKLVKAATPTLPLHTRGLAAAPEDDVGVKRRPVPAVDATKFPFVAVIAPAVAVSVVEAVKAPVTAVAPTSETPAVALPIVVVAVPVALIEAVPACVKAPKVLNPVTPSVELTVAVPVIARRPVRVVFPVALPRASVPVPVPIAVAAAPVALSDAVPT